MPTTRKTFCRICEAHCGLIVDLDDDNQPAKLRPDGTHPISQGFVCAKGLRFLDVAQHPQRLLTPHLRQTDGTLRAATWEEAYRVFADRVRPILAQHGVHSLAVYFGTPMIHHSMLMLTLFQWLRALGTRHLFSAASQDNSSKLAAQKLIHGQEWLMPIADLEHADFALLLGTNPVVSQGTFVHLPGGTNAYDKFLERGGTMVIVDPRESESARRWGGHLAIQPGTDVYLLLAILHTLRDLYQPGMAQGIAELLTLAADYPVERAALLTRIPAEQIEALALRVRTAQRATLLSGVGINQGPFGMLCVILIQAIAYMTGNFDRVGGILFNSWARVLQLLVGIRPQLDRFGLYTSHAGGLPCGILAESILKPGRDQIRALIVVGGNPLTSVPDEAHLRRAFEQLDLLVSIDLFENQTAAAADILLPGRTWLERVDVGAWDAMYETAPMLQVARRVQKPSGNTRSEARIIAELSLAAGKPLFGTRLLAWLWAHVDWDRLVGALLPPLWWVFRRRLRGAEGLPWRRAREGVYRGRRHNRLRFWDPALTGEAARLARLAQQLETPLDVGEFFLLGRRRRLAQNSWIHQAGRDEKVQEACAWLAPDDLSALALAEGEQVLIRSEIAEISLPVKAHDGVRRGTIIIPHGLPQVNVNRLIPSDPKYIEPVSGMHQMVGHRVHVIKPTLGD